ncbi:hypothetical protein Rcae01_04986 [Novipirellula caenicola]|uniref:Uncharacterized protein n=1 Tax=Novipirellula caenicola TaxID=1536901 RepID=A0ABP9VWG5_9BACT
MAPSSYGPPKSPRRKKWNEGGIVCWEIRMNAGFGNEFIAGLHSSHLSTDEVGGEVEHALKALLG